MLPKRVGLPSIKPLHWLSSSSSTYGSPCSGTAGSTACVAAVTGGTVRNMALQESTDSTPREICIAMAAVLPLSDVYRIRMSGIDFRLFRASFKLRCDCYLAKLHSSRLERVSVRCLSPITSVLIHGLAINGVVQC